MEGTLLVTPEVLESTAEEFGQAMRQIEGITCEMMVKVTNLINKWQGEAAIAYINKFDELGDDMAKMEEMVHEHVNDLKLMAAVYRDAESTNLDTATSLPGDVLF